MKSFITNVHIKKILTKFNKFVKINWFKEKIMILENIKFRLSQMQEEIKFIKECL